MTGKSIGNQSPRISHTPQIVIETPVAEEKGEKGSQLSFAQHVNALPDHSRKAIDKYLPTEIEGLSPSTQRKILGEAIRENNLEAVKVLLECGVDVNRYDWRGLTPLCEACEHAHVEIVKVLLNKGADPNIVAEHGDLWAPLHMCIWLDKVKPGQKNLACAELLLNHGADVDRKTHLYESTPLHFVDPTKQPKFLALLLSRGANPLAKNFNEEEPRLRPQHFQGLGPHLTAALQHGKQSRIHRWIKAVERLLPVPKAASLLIEWAPLCSSDLKLSKEIHTIILDYLEGLRKADIEPPADVAEYAKGYNAWFDRQEILDKRQKILDDLAVDGLTTGGIGQGFSIQGEGYSTEKHGDWLIKLATNWAFDPDAFEIMNYVVGILNFAANKARDQKVPEEISDALFVAVQELRNGLNNSPDPEIKKRAKAIDRFLNPFFSGSQ